jgi:hypothetical protein
MQDYRAVCLSCDRTTIETANPTAIPSGTARTVEGVYRAPNGQLCLKCSACKEPKHAVPNSR